MNVTTWISEMFDADDRDQHGAGKNRDYELERRKRVTAMAVCFFQDLVRDARSKVEEFNRELCVRRGITKGVDTNPAENHIELYFDRLTYFIDLDVNAETISVGFDVKTKYVLTLRDGAHELDVKRADGARSHQDFTNEVLAPFFAKVMQCVKR